MLSYTHFSLCNVTSVLSTKKGGTCCLIFKIAFLHLPLCVPDLSVVPAGPSVLGFDKIPWWGILLISLGFSVLTAIVVWFIVCPHLKKKIERKSHYVFDFGNLMNQFSYVSTVSAD